MVARMIKWRPWPSRKFNVRLVVKRATGVVGTTSMEMDLGAAVEIQWKGSRATALGALRRRSRVKRNRTREEKVTEKNGGGEVEWNEEFECLVSLTPNKDNSFHPCEIAFSVFNVNVINLGPKIRDSLIGAASLNVAEFTSNAGEEVELNLPLLTSGSSVERPPSLHLTLTIMELRSSQDTSETVQRCMIPIPLSPTPGATLPFEKDEISALKKEELSALKAGLMKVKLITDFVSTRKSKKTGGDDEGSEGRCSAQSEDVDAYPFDSDSLDDDLEEADAEEDKEDNSFRKSFSYGTLASANFVGSSIFSDMKINADYEDWIYYSHRRSDVGRSHIEMPSSLPEQSVLQNPKRSILPWKRRKLSFKSPKAKGEPLLKKDYGEDGGDDIDFDRRQMSSSDESLPFARREVDDSSTATCSSISDFGDDNFAVGRWETKEVFSRDGRMKLCAQVFFASIDQRSERAAGESACTALVAVIADWFQKNPGVMPIKSQLDSLIREGSLEWRNLCENETYRQRFPDKHFDLDTVLEAKIRPLSVHPAKSFIGFFHPEGTEDVSGFEFLHDAMSFDSIWEEISQAASDSQAGGAHQLYVVSWNDHFFLLKVEEGAYYIIDTLGERLYEGCDQAYILKFADNTSICRVPGEVKQSSETAGSGNQLTQQNKIKEDSTGGEQDNNSNSDCGKTDEEEVICSGKEACKEYIKTFLAAIPIRELQADIKKGLIGGTPLHHRLQIEFHYTESSLEPLATAAFSITPAVNLQMEVA